MAPDCSWVCCPCATDRGVVRLEELIGAARELINPIQRRILGITGAPGSGKTTLADTIDAALGDDSVLVNLDGFHIAESELNRLGRHQRKGAPDTFDSAGYINLLSRLRARHDPIVYAPRFDRCLEESIGSAIPIPDVPMIITEGNYLLLDGPE